MLVIGQIPYIKRILKMWRGRRNMLFVKRKKMKEQNKEVKQEPVKRNKDCTTNNMWFHHTMTSNVTYGSYDSDSH